MKRNLLRNLAVALVLASLCYAQKVGAAAPDFKATDSNGQVRELSEYPGSTWFWNGTIMAVQTRGSITRAATCRDCKKNGLRAA